MDARAYCRGAGGDLATILDQETALFLAPNLGCWIGLFKTPGGEWRWSDGSSAAFTNWNTGEPTEQAGGVVIVADGSGKWNDLGWSVPEDDSIGPRKAVCQFDHEN